MALGGGPAAKPAGAPSFWKQISFFQFCYTFCYFEISEIRIHLQVNSMSGFNWKHFLVFIRI